jgi:hypothetical protein
VAGIDGRGEEVKGLQLIEISQDPETIQSAFAPSRAKLTSS